MVKKLVSWGFLNQPSFLVEIVSEEPDPADLPKDRLVIEMRGPYPKWAHFRCPCPCGEPIAISIANDRSSWRVAYDIFRRPSLYPSINQTRRCQAHFWIEKGDVAWCRDSGRSLGRLDRVF